VLENSKFEANLGNKADYRVLSYKMGKDVCCIQPKDKHPPDNGNLTYLVSMSSRFCRSPHTNPQNDFRALLRCGSGGCVVARSGSQPPPTSWHRSFASATTTPCASSRTSSSAAPWRRSRACVAS